MPSLIKPPPSPPSPLPPPPYAFINHIVGNESFFVNSKVEGDFETTQPRNHEEQAQQESVLNIVGFGYLEKNRGGGRNRRRDSKMTKRS